VRKSPQGGDQTGRGPRHGSAEKLQIIKSKSKEKGSRRSRRLGCLWVLVQRKGGKTSKFNLTYRRKWAEWVGRKISGLGVGVKGGGENSVGKRDHYRPSTRAANKGGKLYVRNGRLGLLRQGR